MALGARDAASALGAPIEIDCCPIADGGEGTAETLAAATGGEMRASRVTGPLGEPVRASWAILGDARTAVIEVAEACGLHLIPNTRRDPMRTTSFGVGELIHDALDAGCNRIIVGLGGSGTTDGGAGMASALGARFDGAPAHVTGGDLARIIELDLCDLDSRLAEASIRVACDVNNPLCGPTGSAAVYGPQKGATTEQVAALDAGLSHLASLTHTDPDTPGAGSAGGLGFGLLAFLGATLEPGTDLVLDVLGFQSRCQGADLILTGEGRLDRQSLFGKACIGIARAARMQRVPTIALVGSVGDGVELTTDEQHGGALAAWRCIVDRPMTQQQAIEVAPELLRRAAEQTIRQWIVAAR